MQKLPKKYIIIEIIPSHSHKEKGHIVQVQALKIQEDQIIERLDLRMIKNLNNQDLLDMISYDRKMFTYLEDEKELMQRLKAFIENEKLLIIDNFYTLDYLGELKNKKESIFSYLHLSYCSDIFDQIMKKYGLEPTKHLVDLLYEALIYEKTSP